MFMFELLECVRVVGRGMATVRSLLGQLVGVEFGLQTTEEELAEECAQNTD